MIYRQMVTWSASGSHVELFSDAKLHWICVALIRAQPCNGYD